ncbi:MAG: ROK family protein [Acetanaerobacterium sp.]
MVLTCVPDARLSLGIEITKYNVSIVTVNLLGAVIRLQHFPVTYQKSESYYSKLGMLIENYIRDASMDRKKILGIGIGVQGLLSSDGKTITFGKILGSTGETLSSYAEHISFPCRLYHDANAAAFAEMWISDHIQNAIYLSLGNNIGGSVFIDGRPYAGTNACSGLVEHMTLVPNGKPCYCGQRGCMESYCTAQTLLEGTEESLEEFFCLLRSGEPSHQKKWEDYLYHLSIAVNNLHMLFDCDIILGGHIGAYIGENLKILKQMAAKRNSFKQEADYLKLCNYTTEAVAAGAAMRYVDEFLKAI